MIKKTKIWIYPMTILGLILILAGGCKKDDNKDPLANVPVLTTDAVTNIIHTSVTCGGNITSDGGLTVVARGLCWSTGQTPTIQDNFTSNGTGAGSFSVVVTGLIPSTTYFLRAYATNSAGTGYGSAMSFTTQQAVADIDGNYYQMITIGSQVWLGEDLKTTKYNDGTLIPTVSTSAEWLNLVTPGYCWYNDDPATFKSTYGALYNWFTVSTGRLAPTGWHVATEADWNILKNFLGGDPVAGGKLKESGFNHWQSPNTGATNESSFTALGSGYRYSGVFQNINNIGIWWSSTEDGSDARACELFYDNSQAFVTSFGKVSGFSVRCVRN